jgi:hypothetical protein
MPYLPPNELRTRFLPNEHCIYEPLGCAHNHPFAERHLLNCRPGSSPRRCYATITGNRASHREFRAAYARGRSRWILATARRDASVDATVRANYDALAWLLPCHSEPAPARDAPTSRDLGPAEGGTAWGYQGEAGEAGCSRGSRGLLPGVKAFTCRFTSIWSRLSPDGFCCSISRCVCNSCVR